MMYRGIYADAMAKIISFLWQISNWIVETYGGNCFFLGQAIFNGQSQ